MRGQRFGLSSACKGGEGHEDFRVGVVLGAGVVAGTEINRGLMMAMEMEARGHFLESLCV